MIMSRRMSLHFVILVLTLICLGFLYSSYLDRVVALSPSFPREEIRDRPFDWRDIDKQEGTLDGNPYTDIRRVNYVSDGRYLNATLWLRGALNASSQRRANELRDFCRRGFSNGDRLARGRLPNRNLEAKWNMDEHDCRIFCTWRHQDFREYEIK